MKLHFSYPIKLAIREFTWEGFIRINALCCPMNFTMGAITFYFFMVLSYNNLINSQIFNWYIWSPKVCTKIKSLRYNTFCAYICSKKQIKLTLGLVLIDSDFINGYADVFIKWHLSLLYAPVRPITSFHADWITPCN